MAETPTPTEQLLHELGKLRLFNPDLALLLRPALLRLAAAVGPEGFGPAAEFARHLVADYEASPWKQAERMIVGEWLRSFEAAARQLAAGTGGTAPPPAEAEPPAAPATVSLVPIRGFSARDWCRVQTAAGIHQRVLRGMEAARNRNRMVASVLETMFAVLHQLGRDRAFAWELEWLAEHRGTLDADVVRDLLLAWTAEADLPAAAREWLLLWSGDEALGRQWPAVVEKADALLRRTALRAWSGDARHDRRAPLAHLRRRIHDGRLDEDGLGRWLAATVGEIGEGVQVFVELSRRAEAGQELEPWRRAALAREAERVCDLYEPVLLLADVLLRQAGGAMRFALAFFGMGRGAEIEWRRRLEELARKNIRRLFLLGLRAGTPPVAVIERLSFGDRTLLDRLRLELDLGTLQFESLKQRERVTDALAVHYLNRREEELLAIELRRRYRDLMRVLHSDSLGRLLPPEAAAELPGRLATLAELIAIATEARRFLARRRNLEETVEERVAADLEFCQSVRRRRHLALRRLVLPAAAGGLTARPGAPAAG
ncbi:MAG: hypothetical protein WC789_12885 [Lentisphaeria bacterium]|jgi:hypothetical protein